MRPFLRHVEQVHEGVIAQSLRPVGEDSVLLLSDVGVEDPQARVSSTEIDEPIGDLALPWLREVGARMPRGVTVDERIWLAIWALGPTGPNRG